MRFVDTQLQQKHTVSLIYRLQRLFFAACMVLGTAAIVVAASTNPPYYGTQPGIATAIATNATGGYGSEIPCIRSNSLTIIRE